MKQSAISTALAAATLFATSSAHAEPPSEVPYEGYLQFADEAGNLSLVDGPTGVRFTIFNYVEGALDPVWTEEWSDGTSRSCSDSDCRIDFDEGFFSVGLGTHEPILDVVLEGSAMYLGVELDGPSGWVELDGVQAIHMRPYALDTAYAPYFDVTGDMTIVGSGAMFFGTMTSGQFLGTTADISGTLGADTAASTGSSEAGSLTATDAFFDGTSVDFGTGRLLATWRSSGTHELLDYDATNSVLQVATNRTIETTDNVVFSRDVTCTGTGCGGQFGLGSYSTEDVWFYVHVVNLDGVTSKATGISTSDYFCWISAVRFGTVAVSTNSFDAEAYTDQVGGEWYVRMDVAGENPGEGEEDRSVRMICNPRNLVQTSGWP